MIGSPYISRIFYTTNVPNEFHEILRISICFDFLKLKKKPLVSGSLHFWSFGWFSVTRFDYNGA